MATLLPIAGIIAAVCLLGQTAGPPVPHAPAAKADACRRIADRLLRIRLPDGTTLRDDPSWTGADDLQLRRAVHECIEYEGIRTDAAGRARVMAAAHLDCVIEASAGSGDQDSPAARLRMFAGDTLQAVGIADPPFQGQDGGATPKGWENVSPLGRELAADAARAACFDRLLALVVEQSPAAPPAMVAALRRDLEPKVAFDPPVYEPSQVCVVRGQLSSEAVHALFASVGLDGRHDAVATGEAPAVDAIGYGIPPVLELSRPDRRLSDHEPPEWAYRTLAAVGRGAVAEPTDESDDARLAAKRAARVDAIIKLAREIDELPLALDGWDTVGQFISAHEEHDDVWTAYLRSVRAGDVTWDQGICRVTMEFDLLELWLLVASRMEAQSG